MLTFPTSPKPGYGSQKASSPQVTTVAMGDGYEQRLQIGLNQNPNSWNLVWRNLTLTDASTIENFLIARKGTEAFKWTPLDENVQYTWKCSGWTKTLPTSHSATIQATFIQTFDLE